jgi:hypothetical protein
METSEAVPAVEIQSLQPMTNAGYSPEAAADEHVLAPGPGNHGAQLGHGERAHQGVQPAGQPEQQEDHGIGQVGGDLARGPENADADGVADDDGDAERDAEDLQETRSSLAIGCRHGGLSVRRGVSSLLQ